MHRALVSILLTTAAVVLSLAQVHTASALVNGHIEPTGTFYAGDKATVVLNFNTPRVFGNETLDEDGKFKYDIYVTLRLDGETIVKPRNFTQGVWVAPGAKEFPVRFQIDHPLSIGKWIVDVSVFQQWNDGMRADNVTGVPFEIDVLQRPAPDKNWFQLLLENSATLPATIIGGLAVAVIIAILKLTPQSNGHNNAQNVSQNERTQIDIERRRYLQHVRDDMTALPREYLRNLEAHYCRLKKEGKPAIFSERSSTLRNQADTVEATLDNVAGIVMGELYGHDEFGEFTKQYGDRFLYSWILCKEDVESAKGLIDQNAGARFKELGEMLAKRAKSLPDPECNDGDGQS